MQIFAVFEYLNRPEYVARLRAVVGEAWEQLGEIERVARAANPHDPRVHLQEWWNLFIRDHFLNVQQHARTFADLAITIASRPYTTANNAGRNLATYAQVMATLRDWLAILEIRISFPQI
jgi:hypothetical protein